MPADDGHAEEEPVEGEREEIAVLRMPGGEPRDEDQQRRDEKDRVCDEGQLPGVMGQPRRFWKKRRREPDG